METGKCWFSRDQGPCGAGRVTHCSEASVHRVSVECVASWAPGWGTLDTKDRVPGGGEDD